MRRNSVQRCPSGKIRLRDEMEALMALASCQAENTIRGSDCRKEKRAYLCDDCGGWHLTSRDSFDGSGVTL